MQSKKQYWLFSLIIMVLNLFLVMHAAAPRRGESSRAVNPQAPVMQSETTDENGVVERNLEDLSVDHEAKRNACIKLVDKAVKYFNANTLEQACAVFSHTKQFVDGELYVFIFDVKGYTFAHPEEDLLWSNLFNLKDDFGAYPVQSIIKRAEEGGGWATYQWRNTTKVSWVQKVTKGDKTYALGSGYYPHAKEDIVVSLVKGAIEQCKQYIKRGQPMFEAFSDLSYPLGRFVFGDLYLYVLDSKGTLMAQGERPQLIGTNAWAVKDANGKLVNQEIITKLQESSEGIWTDYISKRATKKAYAEKVADAQGNMYAIVCGYYPDTTRKTAKDLVKKGYTYMKQNGKTAAVEAFSSKRDDEYRYGDLYLVVFDLKGTIIAHGGNAELIGSNQFEFKDEDGRYFVKDMLDQAQEFNVGGWVTYKKNKSLQSVYFEKIELGIDQFIIASGLYPISKKETADLMLQTGKSYFENKQRKEALAEFVKKDGKFISGDLSLFVFDTAGICFSYGDDHDLIWRNLFNLKDDDGKPYVKLFINAITRGPDKVTYKMNGRTKIALLEPVEKGGKRYVIGTAYFV
jgi:cytochrome c